MSSHIKIPNQTLADLYSFASELFQFITLMYRDLGPEKSKKFKEKLEDLCNRSDNIYEAINRTKEE